ncbi:MAG: hypothetical protein EOP50_16670 [Sphingobacteriales bacterium]|nr:MAG: hypothetical protein EOP50_16670 [Sphingobacteriales bacterium]
MAFAAAPATAQLRQSGNPDSHFSSYMFMYCGIVPTLPDGERAFVVQLLGPIQETAAKLGKTPAEFFIYPGCEPNYIAGTDAPIAHIVAENPTDRMQHLKFAEQYFAIKMNRPDLFVAILNARNTQGMTTLDYVEYVMFRRGFNLSDAPGVANFIDYLCAKGAVYSYYREKTCATPDSSRTEALTLEGIIRRMAAWRTPPR